MGKDTTYIKFPVGTNKAYRDDVCYELDRETDTLTISFEGYFYSFPERLAPCLIYIFGLGGVEILKILFMFISIVLLFLFILEMISKGSSSLSQTLLICTCLVFVSFPHTFPKSKITIIFLDVVNVVEILLTRKLKSPLSKW